MLGGTAMAQNTQKSKPLGFWLLLLGIILVLCAAAILVMYLTRQPGTYVRISQDGEVTHVFPIDEDRTVPYDTVSGGHNVVVIADGRVSVTEANCPDQVCVRHAPIQTTGDTPIVCLPNRLVVEIIGPADPNQPDSVS